MKYQVINHQHIFESETEFAQCHASTVCRLPDGAMGAAWFAGAHEKAPDVAIWFSRRERGEWSKPAEVARGDGEPCWNPVLFAAEGRLLLFYKIGPDPERWRTMVKESADSGKTWGEARELVAGDVGGRGPVKNKCIVLRDGKIAAPASIERGSWDCFVDLSADGGKTWTKSETIPFDREGFSGAGMIQPALWEDGEGIVHALMRSSEGAIYRSRSRDGGKTWSAAQRTSLPNNNCGIDVARLEDGRLVLVYNPVSGNWAARSPIAFSVSWDNGESWSAPQILDHVPCDSNLERAEFSYPAVIAEGNDAFITYTWKRRTIAFWHIRFPQKKDSEGNPEGMWPVMLTPFTEEGAVDEAGLKALTEWYLDQGAAGLFAVCLSSEIEQLSREERLSLAKSVVNYAAKRAPVAAVGNYGSTPESLLEDVRRMAETGVDIVVLTTGFLAQEEGDEGMRRALEELLRALPGTRFGLYECPMPKKRLLSPELLGWCARTGRFVFLKETSCSREQLKEKLEAVKGTPLKVYNADTSLILDSLRMGGSGYCGVMFAFHPDLYRRMWKSWADDRQLAEEMQQLMTVTAQIEGRGYPKNAKYALAQRGLPISDACRRAVAWDESCVRAVEQMQAYVENRLRTGY